MSEETPPQIIGFHGTTAGYFGEFLPKFRSGEQLGFGIHFAESRDFAEMYATDPRVARKGKSPTIYTAQLTINAPLNACQIVSEGTASFDLAVKLAGKRLWTDRDHTGKRCAWLQNAIDATSPTRALKIITEAGFDGVIYESRVGTQGINARISAKSKSFIVFNDAQVEILDRFEFGAQPAKFSSTGGDRNRRENESLARNALLATALVDTLDQNNKRAQKFKF